MGHPGQVTAPKPPWLKVRLPTGEAYADTLRAARARGLHTVCEDARCPNIAECWGRRTATFMMLGDVCTRACGFCAVKSGRPGPVDPDEPRRTAEAIRALGIRHAVVTSVNRDDLPDGGASLFAELIRQVRRLAPGTTIEVLTPDFRGDRRAVDLVLDERPDVFAHNVECVPRLQRRVRSAATWECSAAVLAHSRRRGLLTKTGLQVGHGETMEELVEAIDRLAAIPVDVLTVGQYLQPTRDHLPVRRFWTPDEFGAIEREARARGIRAVFSGPLVRSSYRAEEAFALTARGVAPAAPAASGTLER
jgi:lipoic acid synthetase